MTMIGKHQRRRWWNAEFDFEIERQVDEDEKKNVGIFYLKVQSKAVCYNNNKRKQSEN